MKTFSLDDTPVEFQPPPKQMLTIELVPATAWGSNVRSKVKRARWDEIRKAQYHKASYRCEVCGGTGSRRNHALECHEVWDYNDETHVQKLVGLLALCPGCHSVKHFGLSQMMGKEIAATQHLMTVNGWIKSQVKEHLLKVCQTWEERSRHEWTLDLSWLDTLP